MCEWTFIWGVWNVCFATCRLQNNAFFITFALQRIKNGEFLSYDTWNLTENSFKPSLSLLATGVGGVLYPPHLLKLSELLNVNEINKYISVDDLWLKAVELVGRVPVVLCDSKVDRVRIELPGAAENGLTKVNVELNQNDMYWSLLNREYNLISKFTD